MRKEEWRTMVSIEYKPVAVTGSEVESLRVRGVKTP